MVEKVFKGRMIFFEQWEECQKRSFQKEFFLNSGNSVGAGKAQKHEKNTSVLDVNTIGRSRADRP